MVRRKVSAFTIIYHVLNLGPLILRILLRLLMLVVVTITVFAALNFLTGGTVLVLLGASGAFLNVSASGNQFFGLVPTIFNVAQDASDLFTDLVIQLMECKEPVVGMHNSLVTGLVSFFWKFSEIADEELCDDSGDCIIVEWSDPDYSIGQCPPLSAIPIYRAVNDSTAGGLPPPRSSLMMLYDTERAVQERDFEETYAHILPFYEAEVARMGGHPDEASRQAKAAARRESQTRMQERFIPIIIQAICDAIDAIFPVVSDLLQLITNTVLLLIDILAEFFNNGFSITLVEAIARLIFTAVLQEIPFTACFVNPDDLEGASPEDIPALFAQTPQRLPKCLNPFTFNSPLPGPDCIIQPCNGNFQDGTVIVKALCMPFPSLDSRIRESDDPVNAILRCARIDLLVEVWNNFVGFVQNVVLGALNGLQVAYNVLLDQFRNLSDDFEELFDDIQSIADDFGLREELEARRLDLDTRLNATIAPRDADALVAQRDVVVAILNAPRRSTAAREARPPRVARDRNRERYNSTQAMVELIAVRDNAERLVRNAVDNLPSGHSREFDETTRPSTPSPSQFLNNTAHAAGVILESINNATRDARTLGLRERFIARISGTPWVASMRERYGEDGGALAAKLINVTRDAFEAFSDVVSSGMSMGHARARFARVDVHGAKRALHTLAARDRAARGIDESARRDVRDRLTNLVLSISARVAGTDALPRIRAHLAAKYNDPELTNPHGNRTVHQEYRDIFELGERARVEAAALLAARDQRTKAARESWGAGRWRDSVRDSVRAMRVDTARRYAELGDQYDDLFLAFSEDEMPSERVIQMVLALGTSGISFVVLGCCGGIGIGLTSCGAVLAGVLLMPLLTFVGSYAIMEAFKVVFSVSVGLISNTAGATPTAWDFFTPLLDVFVSRFKQMIQGPVTTADLESDVLEVADIILEDVMLAINTKIHDGLCAFPPGALGLGCPASPIIGSDGRPTQTFFDYVRDVAYVNIGCPCQTPADAVGRASCRCSIDADSGDWRRREGTDDNPCTVNVFCSSFGCPPWTDDFPAITPPCVSCTRTFITGEVISWPLLKTGVYFDTLDLQTDGDLECESDLGFDQESLKYYNEPWFKDVLSGASPWYLVWTDASFYSSFAGVASNGNTVVKYFTRWMFRGGAINRAAALIGVAPAILIPGPVGTSVAVLVTYVNVLTPWANSIGRYSIGMCERIQKIPLFGDQLGTFLLGYIRSDNASPDDPFGTTPGRETACVFMFLPAGGMTTAVVILFSFILLGAYVGGGIPLVLDLWALIIFPFQLVVALVRLGRHAYAVRSANVVTSADMRDTEVYSMPVSEHIIPEARSQHVDVDGLKVYRTHPAALKEVKPGVAAAYAARMVVGAVLDPLFWSHVWDDGERRQYDHPLRVTIDSNTDEHPGIPYADYLYAGRLPITASQRHAVVRL